ncbi:unnamed protein product, partial [Mesorhabditis belari]|uniref:Uncharacterized protein n=1 Tax=Mesorhabditis belari TaxID=2138241 RepID=A0AAF3EQC5_9BILA
MFDLEIEQKVKTATTDGGSDVKKAIRDHLKLNWVNCFGHKLNLVVRRLLKQSFLLSIIDRMKSAVRRIHKSGISRRKFIGLCKEYACPLVVPRSECETRWNSLYYLLIDCLRAKDVL